MSEKKRVGERRHVHDATVRERGQEPKVTSIAIILSFCFVVVLHRSSLLGRVNSIYDSPCLRVDTARHTIGKESISDSCFAASGLAH